MTDTRLYRSEVERTYNYLAENRLERLWVIAGSPIIIRMLYRA